MKKQIDRESILNAIELMRQDGSVYRDKCTAARKAGDKDAEYYDGLAQGYLNSALAIESMLQNAG